MMQTRVRSANAGHVRSLQCIRAVCQVTKLRAASMEVQPATCAPSLYLLHWHDSSSPSGPTSGAAATTCSTTYVESLRMQLKTMEKVAKKAVWFNTVTADTDGQHVLLVTDSTKLGRKYNLTVLPGDAPAYSMVVGGSTTVTIPTAAIREACMKAMEEDSSDSEDEMDMPAKAPKAACAPTSAVEGDVMVGKDATKAAKAAMKAAKEEEKMAREMEKEMEKKAKKAAKEAAKNMPMAATAVTPAMDGEDSGSSSDEDDAKCMPVTMAAQDAAVDLPAPPPMMQDGEDSSSSSDEEDCMQHTMAPAPAPATPVA